MSEVTLHPLALLNMSDYYTRASARGTGVSRVVGLLLGSVTGGDVVVETTIEMLVTSDGLPDARFMKERVLQYKEVLEHVDVVGLYAIGQMPSQHHVEIQRVVLETLFSDGLNSGRRTPLVLALFEPESLKDAGDDLPLKMYELANIAGDAHELKVVVGAGEGERIAVEDVSRGGSGSVSSFVSRALAGGDAVMTDGNETTTDSLDALAASAVDTLSIQRGAVRSLGERLGTITSYLRGIQDGSIAYDASVVARAQHIVTLLSSLQADIAASGAAGGKDSIIETANGDATLVKELDRVVAMVGTTQAFAGVLEANGKLATAAGPSGGDRGSRMPDISGFGGSGRGRVNRRGLGDGRGQRFDRNDMDDDASDSVFS
ncbi:hypothetical protein PYCC9005_004492 [Savitreella phatthalungensis]